MNKDTFKVVCKNNGTWIKIKGKVKSCLWGLIKWNKGKPVHGPSKEEICIVNSSYIADDNDTYYNLSGYPYGGYNSKHFIPLDEIEETQKEIAKKSQPVLN